MHWIRLTPATRDGPAAGSRIVRDDSYNEVRSRLGTVLRCRWVWWLPTAEDAWNAALRCLGAPAGRVAAPVGLSEAATAVARSTGEKIVEVDLDAASGRPLWCTLPPPRDAERSGGREVYIVDHRFGFPTPIPRLDPDAAVIEDATAAVGGAIGGRPVGSLGDVAIVALGHPPFGRSRGALIATDVPSLAGHITPRLSPTSIPPDALAALASDLDGLDEWVEGCRAAAQVYESAWRSLHLPLRPLIPAPGTTPTYTSYVVLVDDPDGLGRALEREGVETRRPAEAHAPGLRAWPGAREFYRRALMLPNHPGLDLERLMYIAGAVRAVLTAAVSPAMEG